MSACLTVCVPHIWCPTLTQLGKSEHFWIGVWDHHERSVGLHWSLFFMTSNKNLASKTLQDTPWRWHCFAVAISSSIHLIVWTHSTHIDEFSHFPQRTKDMSLKKLLTRMSIIASFAAHKDKPDLQWKRLIGRAIVNYWPCEHVDCSWTCNMAAPRGMRLATFTCSLGYWAPLL